MQRVVVELLFKPRCCSLFSSVARRATTLFFLLQHCASCGSVAHCAAALRIVPWRYALWFGTMRHVGRFALCRRHCALCRSIGNSIVRLSNSTARPTFAPFTFIEKMEKQSTGGVGDSVCWWRFDITWLSGCRIEK